MSGRTWILGAFLALGACSFAACDDNTPTCIPDTVENDCICKKGDRGHHVCDKDGLHYGECFCGVAGTGGSSAAGASNAGSSGESGKGGTPAEGGSAGDVVDTGGVSAAGGS